MKKLTISSEQTITLTGDEKGNLLQILNEGPNDLLFCTNTDTTYITVPPRACSTYLFDFGFNLIDSIKFKTDAGKIAEIEYDVLNKNNVYKINLIANTPYTINFDELHRSVNIQNVNGVELKFVINQDVMGTSPIVIANTEKIRNMEFDGYFAKATFLSSVHCTVILGVE